MAWQGTVSRGWLLGRGHLFLTAADNNQAVVAGEGNSPVRSISLSVWTTRCRKAPAGGSAQKMHVDGAGRLEPGYELHGMTVQRNRQEGSQDMLAGLTEYPYTYV